MTTAAYRGVEPDRGAGRGLGWRLRQPFVPAAKATLRGVAMVTAHDRPPPDFLVIGAKRGGSTTLYRSLLATPGVLGLVPEAARLKGTYYFDVEHRRGDRWYRSHFPRSGDRERATRAMGHPVASGEASPYYLSHPHAADRAHHLAPDALVVAVLRDPVARARSHHKERVRQGIEPVRSFADAIAAEPDRLEGEWERMLDDPAYVSLPHLNFGYLAQSDYAPGLARWRTAYGADRVLVLRSEDLYADPAAAVNQVRERLGLPRADLPEARHDNDTGPADLDPGLEAELRARLAPSVSRLEADLGRSMGWPAATR